MRRIHRAAAAAVALVVGGALVPLAAPPAGAVVNPLIVVTTTADVVNGGDGVLSLREAVNLANATFGADTIQLATGASYPLTLCTPGLTQEDANISGDLDATDVAGVTIQGTTSSIVQTCRVSASVAAERVIQAVAGPLTLTGLRLTGGNATSGGIAVDASSDLTVSGVVVSGSDGAGPSSGYDPGAIDARGQTTTISNSTISDTTGGSGIVLHSSSPSSVASINGSTITDNRAPGGMAGGVFDERADGSALLAITSSTIARNSSVGPSPAHSGLAGGLYSAGGITMSSSKVTANAGFSGGGLFIGGPSTVTGTEVTDNQTSVAGGGIQSADLRVTVDSSYIAGNHAVFQGGGFWGPGSIENSTISQNSAAAGGGLGVENYFGPLPHPAVSLILTNTTVTRNSAFGAGGLFVDNQNGPAVPTVEVSHSTLVGNTASSFGQGNEVATLASPGLTQPIGIAASIIGSSTTPGPDCGLPNGTFSSGGYNFTVDASCGKGMAGTDRVSGGDPMLVAASGAPAFGSPVKDAIPAAAALCTGTDQLGNPRPATPGTNCDIGAIEATGPVYTNDGTFTALSPTRVLDTRIGLGNVPSLRAGLPQRMTIAGVGGVPATASAVVVNLTATNASVPTFVTAFPGDVATPPVASNLNVVPGQSVPNLVTVKVGKGGTIAFSVGAGTVDLVGDVVGYYELPAASGGPSTDLSTTVPTRVIDTRPGAGHLGFNTVGSGQTGSLVIPSAPAGATSVVLNVTVTNPTAAGYVTVFPTASAPNPPPTASNLNFVPGQTVANLVIAKLGTGGSVSFFNSFGSTDLVVDVVGWYTTSSTLRFTSVNPVRLLDSRQPGAAITRLSPVTHHDLVVVDGVAVPADAKAVLVNVTAVSPSAPGFLTVYPTAAPPNAPPLASNLNFTAGAIVPNLVVATLSADGKLSIYNGSTGGSVDVVVDLVGWYR